ncbi:MAG: serine O-acetyltransferase [Candidatus Gastranaerophilales bacterium]|nr:serine O-acetyltransferase [Candidatus Gastranaerophilales bacterium]
MRLLKKAITQIKEDIKTIYEKDPAATNILEVILCYPGLHALIAHRIAHKLNYWNIPFIPRFISFVSRFFTGIEIHPAATIGRRFFIDHGMGVVIGETAIIGDDVLLYQGATLGGTGKEHGKRHPTVCDNVVVGSGAKVLGNITIGSNSRIGAGSVVIDDVPDDCTVVGIPGRIVHQKVFIQGQLMHNRIPDPVTCQLNRMKYEIQEIREQLQNKNKN